MSSQKIVWTALPNGYDETGTYLKLSVFVSPRLTPDLASENTLAAFPDWVDWPANKITFKLVFDTPAGERSLTPSPDPASPSPDSELWRVLFPGDTPVDGFNYKPLDGLPIRSYHALGLHDWLKGRYQTVATQNPTDYPPITALTGLLGDLQYRDKQDDNMKQAVLTEPFAPAGEAFSAHKDFFRFRAFHKPFSLKQMPVTLPHMDFHAMVGALARYPNLMRQLGLVYDLLVPRGDVSLPLVSTVRVIPQWQHQGKTEDVRPKTHYTFGGGQERLFQAQPRPGNPPEYVAGMLPLGDPVRYGVTQLDVDGLAFKSLDLAGNLTNLAANPFNRPLANHWLQQKPEPAEALPSGSSTGLAVVKNYRAAFIHDLLVANTVHNTRIESGTGDTMDLYLEDLVRGHRVDVWDEISHEWHSLHSREGTYSVKGKPIAVKPDEGWAMTGTAAPMDPAAPQELRLSETIAEWAGWSLSASRPESVIGTKDEIRDEPGRPVAPEFKLEVTFAAVKRSLPRLRFGRKYRLKIRSVDLAGNGPDPSDRNLNPQVLSPYIRYQRYEPVAQPVLIPRDRYKDSESVEHLVVRTWTTPAPGAASTEITERHVAPPITTVRTAELHGMLDGLGDPKSWRPDAYDLLTHLEGAAPLAEKPATEKQWKLNYLCDPVAHGAAFTGLPGTGTAQTVPFDTTPWPKYQPFRLKVVGGDGAPGPDPLDPGTFKVELPKAEVARVRMSCYPTQAELEKQLGIWRWVMEKFTSNPDTPPTGNPSYTKLLKQALIGQHWMVTPYREILLIHAVQQPLVAPKFAVISPFRTMGATWADIRYGTPLNGKSTQKLDVTATWSEHIDPLAKSKWEVVDGSAHAFSTSINPEILALESQGRHEFGDTKHRLVKYKGTALTRFPEFFPPGTAPLTRTTDETTGDQAVHVPSSARPDVPDVLYVLPIFEWVDGNGRLGRSVTRKGNALRIYLNRPWYSSGDDEKLGIILNVRPKTGTWTADFTKEARWKYESGWAEDPIITSGPTPPTLQPTNFSRAKPAVDGLSLAEISASQAMVVPHEVAYDEAQKLWYCDVRIEPADAYPAYMSFVRLALARYQPYSIPDTHLSRITLADFSQLTADRTASISSGAKAGEYNVSLFGLHAHVSGGAGPWRRVEVTVEQNQVGGADFGWAPVGLPVTLSVTNMVQPNLFTGTVKIPAGQDPAKHRLVFKEYEKLIADPDDRNLASPPKEVWRLIFAHAMAFAL